jgi:hypothetical protein
VEDVCKVDPRRGEIEGGTVYYKVEGSDISEIEVVEV